MRVGIGERSREFAPEAVVVAGYTGRDRDAVQHHIDELAAIGIPRPSSIPTYWLLPPWLLTASDNVVVAGAGTSGEAEVCLWIDRGERFVGLASDHTDREAEAIDIGLSKAICPVPVVGEAWPVDELDGHWDDLVLRSWILEGDTEVLYQDGPCSSLVPPLDLLAGYSGARPDRFVMLTGTVGVLGDIRPSRRFRAELHDPVLERSLHLSYAITALGQLPAGVATGKGDDH